MRSCSQPRPTSSLQPARRRSRSCFCFRFSMTRMSGVPATSSRRAIPTSSSRSLRRSIRRSANTSARWSPPSTPISNPSSTVISPISPPVSSVPACPRRFRSCSRAAFPVRLFLSGPAAGVIGAKKAGEAAGARDLITVDIGGTSCDIALIENGTPALRSEGVIDRYPVRVSMVDVNSIGAGGGPVAWLDAAGGLRVGPRSAGSEPGPACYGLGGNDPTVNDGHLHPEHFAGGSLKLRPELAREAIERMIARPLKLNVEQAALGIHRIMNSQVSEGIRLVSIRQGYDPRKFTLLPLGGGGALHACALAEELGVARILG